MGTLGCNVSMNQTQKNEFSFSETLIFKNCMCEPPSSDSDCLFSHSQGDRSTLDSHYIPSTQSTSDEGCSTDDQFSFRGDQIQPKGRVLIEVNESLAAGQMMQSSSSSAHTVMMNGAEPAGGGDRPAGEGDETR